MGKILDLTNQRYGMLIVLNKLGSVKDSSGHSEVEWQCRCDCGNITTAKTGDLRKGKKKSCGCLVHKVKDLSGQKFGKLTVSHRIEDRVSPSGKHRIMWHCKCDCGGEIDVVSQSLKGGHTRSCGCLQNFDDLTGKRFGKLVVLYRAESRIRHSGKPYTIWHCKCDCGNECDVNANSLKQAHAYSCGCFRMSIGEDMIEDAFKTLELNYKSQVTFDGLVGVGGRPLRYDFGLYDFDGNLIALIEYNGEQHYKPVKYFDGDGAFETRRLNYEIKVDYARHVLRVPLIEISYNTMSFQEIFNILARIYHFNDVLGRLKNVSVIYPQ